MSGREPKRFAIVASASGNGKTQLGRELARRLSLPFVELDALHYGPSWTEATAGELRAKVEPIVAGDEWVIDGGYWGKLGDLVLGRAELVVWLDLYAIRNHPRHRREYPERLAPYEFVRLRSTEEVAAWLARFA